MKFILGLIIFDFGVIYVCVSIAHLHSATLLILGIVALIAGAYMVCRYNITDEE
jgi:membrane-bound ClpP family serine protease